MGLIPIKFHEFHGKEYKCKTLTFASLELSQTVKKISHAEQTSPEKNSI